MVYFSIIMVVYFSIIIYIPIKSVSSQNVIVTLISPQILLTRGQGE